VSLARFLRSRVGFYLSLFPRILTLKDLFRLAIRRVCRMNGPLTVKPKPFGCEIVMRCGDLEMLREVLGGRYHLPPIDLPRDGVIFDIGCHIGLTLLDLKQCYPDSTIIGYEMDRENFELAVRNTERLSNVHVYHNAVWCTDGILEYAKHQFDATHSLVKKDDACRFGEVEAVSLSTALNREDLPRVDYLKMDIEGAETAVLEGEDLRWLAHIRSLSIECHFEKERQTEEMTRCLDVLRIHGFKAWKDDEHWLCIKAVEEGTSS
jgi:FkbM family methyltransferase